MIGKATTIIIAVPNLGFQLKTTNEGCALEHLRKLVVLYPQGVVYITLNLSHVMIHKSDLCVTETAQILIDQLRNPGDISGGKEGNNYPPKILLKCF